MSRRSWRRYERVRSSRTNTPRRSDLVGTERPSRDKFVPFGDIAGVRHGDLLAHWQRSPIQGAALIHATQGDIALSEIDTKIGSKEVGRRTVIKTAAWSVPVIAAAVATPFASASVAPAAVNGLRVDGSCGLLGVLGPGFTVKAGSTPIPAGTVITIKSSGLLSVSAISLSGQGLANINLLNSNTVAITLAAPLAAGQTMIINWLLSINLFSEQTATLTLPTGYTLGTGCKPTGTLNTTLIFCNAG